MLVVIKMKNERICFGSNLKKLRVEAGYSRSRLAQIIAYSEKSIEKWEMTDALPPVHTVCRLADLFGVSVDAILYAPDTGINYFLGIDGGGTKTAFLLTDVHQKPIASLVLGPANPIDIGIENALGVLQQGINQLCKGIRKKEISVFAGLAGGTTSNSQKEVNAFFAQLGFGCFANGNDTESVVESTLNGDDGIALIMGTGIIAFAQKNGKRKRIGGWGYLIDKGGSGYNFGADALDAALKSIDGRGDSTIMKELIEKNIGTPLPDAISEMYRKGKAYIASLAPVVFEAFLREDAEAREIIEKNVQEVAKIIRAGQRFLEDENPKIVICGGLCHQKDILLPFFNQCFEHEPKIIFHCEPIVNGAVSIAKRNAERMYREYAEN